MDNNQATTSVICLMLFVCLSPSLSASTTRPPSIGNTWTDDQSQTGYNPTDPAMDGLNDQNGNSDIVIIPLSDIVGVVTADGDIQPTDGTVGDLPYSLDNNMQRGGRKKRWVPLAVGLAVRGAAAGYRAFRGWRAAQKLRAGAQLSKLNKPSMRVTELNRKGNFRDAFKTFKSLKPTNIKRIRGPNGVRGVTGRVGNRVVTVRNKSGKGGRGGPTIEMFKSGARKGNKKIDKLRFH